MNAEPTTPTKTRGQRVWTDAQRAAQARNIREHRIWNKATGPKTEAGKRISARNSYKHGRYSFENKVLRWYVRLAVKRLKFIHCQYMYQSKIRENELLNKYGIPTPRKPDARAYHRFFRVSPLSPEYKKLLKSPRKETPQEVFDYFTTLSELPVS